MLRLNKNSANDCVFTLNEKTTLTGGTLTYLLEIYSNQNHSSKVIRLSGDTSLNTVRYNQFEITEVASGSEDFNLAHVNLEPGTYDYRAWQTTGATIALSAATSIVESGKMRVIGSATTVSTFDDPNTEYTFE